MTRRLCLHPRLRRGIQCGPPHQSSRRDRGAVLVEFAFVLPLLMLISMGIVEYGMGWKWANDINAAARDAARNATSEPVFATSDRSAMLSIATSLSSDQLSGVQQVIIFSATSADGSVPKACTNLNNTSGGPATPGTPVGVNGSCNIYGKGQLQYLLANPDDMSPWLNAAGNGCDSSDLPSHWCPTGRDRSMTTNKFSYLGVYIKVKRPSITHMGFGDFTIERSTVFRFEPAFGGT